MHLTSFLIKPKSIRFWFDKNALGIFLWKPLQLNKNGKVFPRFPSQEEDGLSEKDSGSLKISRVVLNFLVFIRFALFTIRPLVARFELFNKLKKISYLKTFLKASRGPLSFASARGTVFESCSNIFFTLIILLSDQDFEQRVFQL